jgi:hypothetical protein
LNSSPQKKRRALLLFTRSPKNEACHKPLERLSFAERVGLYEEFTRHVLAQAHALDCPILVATDEPEYNFARYSSHVVAVFQQRGAAFGDKLAHALKAAFAQGFDEIVCMGNDCLELSAADLHSAFAQLTQCELALGAAEDGGVYLIGMRRESLTRVLRAVAECRWQTAIVLEDLSASARDYAIATAVLAQHRDIDTADDLTRACRSLPALRFLRRFDVLLLLPHSRFSPALLSLPRTRHYDPLRFQKAPPAFLR